MATTKIHGGVSGGGNSQLVAHTVSAIDVDATVLLASGANPLTGNLPAGGFRVTGLADPAAAQDAATRAYVDAHAPAIVGAALTVTSDPNVTLALTGTPASALLAAVNVAVAWAGTLAAARLNANVVQAVTSDPNVTGAIAAQTLTLGWAGTLAPARGGLGFDVSTIAKGGLLVGTAAGALGLKAVGTDGQVLTADAASAGGVKWATPATVSSAALTKTDDTNVTLALTGTPASALLAAVNIAIGWTGTLAAARLNPNVVQAVTNDTNVTGAIAAQTLTLGWTGRLAPARGGLGVDASTIAKGGLLVGTGAGTIGITAVGADGQVLTADSTQASGMKWAAAAGGTITGGGAAGNLAQWNSATGLTSGPAAANVPLLNAANNFTAAQSSSVSFSATDMYVTNGWFRNTASSQGLYSQPNDRRFACISTNYWGLQGSTGVAGLVIYGDAFATARGYLYTDGTNFGLLSSNGNWMLYAAGAGNLTFPRNVVQSTGCYLYPGSASGDANLQTSWYLASHSSYGLYTNTGLYAASSLRSGSHIYASGSFYANTGGGLLFNGDSGTGYISDITGRLKMISSAGPVALYFDGNQYFPIPVGTLSLGHPSYYWLHFYYSGQLVQISDARLKEKIRPTTFGSAFIRQLRAVDFEWRDRQAAGVQQGFLAQEVAAVAPTFSGVNRGEGGIATGLDYTRFIAPLVATVQELLDRIARLEGTRS